MSVIESTLSNNILFVSMLAWLLAQGAKILLAFFLGRKLSFWMLMESGGFPSSHSALVSAMAVQVGQVAGWDTPIFAVCLIFAFVVMYDAAGVRRAAGEHAYLINEIIDRLDLSHIHKSSKKAEDEKKRLKELIGHTPFEVFGGAVVGVLIAILL
ncbi:MAG: divergent PAP2 family protein [Peptococcaceae bacterium]|jgi:acid phosphatase family membrane protein YuiD|nr:divergent PAP2 family protein [Peptococcaceae bacterium]MDR2736632.1 divergent PAP2 family protein [Gracilibacteraceae bacterium]